MQLSSIRHQSNKIWKTLLNRSVGVIAISKKINSWLIEEVGIKSEKITTIHYGIEIKQRNIKNSNNNSIGMAARILPWKGWDKVIETSYYLKELGVDFTLKLAGSDDEDYLKIDAKFNQDFDKMEHKKQKTKNKRQKTKYKLQKRDIDAYELIKDQLGHKKTVFLMNQ